MYDTLVVLLVQPNPQDDPYFMEMFIQLRKDYSDRLGGTVYTAASVYFVNPCLC